MHMHLIFPKASHIIQTAFLTAYRKPDIQRVAPTILESGSTPYLTPHLLSGRRSAEDFFCQNSLDHITEAAENEPCSRPRAASNQNPFQGGFAMNVSSAIAFVPCSVNIKSPLFVAFVFWDRFSNFILGYFFLDPKTTWTG